MKVIMAGISKTGTKTMTAALKELGLNVYDYLEHYLYNGEDWMKICIHGGTTEDFRRMYEDVDAAVDLPAWYFWEELHEAFPDAKIILTMRENEDVWFNSLVKQQDTLRSPIFILMRYLSPTYRRFRYYGTTIGLTAYGVMDRSWFKHDDMNELLMKMVYRQHNAYVLEAAPRDKLLVYNVKDGWEPLCEFLGLEVPSKPFPHKNARGKITDEMLAENPFFIRMQRELLLSLSLIAILFSYGCYRVVKSPPSPQPPSSLIGYCTENLAFFAGKLKFW